MNKIVEVYRSGKAYDTLVILRGGGAETDFLIFDHYLVARAVARFPMPVLTGIGHQKNETLCDLVAHTATKTPTKVAEFIIARNRDFEQSMLQLQKNLVIKSQQLLAGENKKLNSLNTAIVSSTRNLLTRHKDALIRCNQVTINATKSILFRHKASLNNLTSQLSIHPKGILYKSQADLDQLCRNLKNSNAQYLKNKAVNLSYYASVIKLMSPENILARGFAIVRVKGKIMSDPQNIELGQEISVILARQELSVTVTAKKEYKG